MNEPISVYCYSTLEPVCNSAKLTGFRPLIFHPLACSLIKAKRKYKKLSLLCSGLRLWGQEVVAARCPRWPHSSRAYARLAVGCGYSPDMTSTLVSAGRQQLVVACIVFLGPLVVGTHRSTSLESRCRVTSVRQSLYGLGPAAASVRVGRTKHSLKLKISATALSSMNDGRTERMPRRLS